MSEYLNILIAYLAAVWRFVEAMAPYLTFGLFLAGVMHVFLPKSMIERHLSKPGMGSVFKASFIGVPMPLCSCSVIPVAQHLHNSGASKGATLSFVSSTPSTGVDSITALMGLMGPIYTLFKVILSFVGGWATGALATIIVPESDLKSKSSNSDSSKSFPLKSQDATITPVITELKWTEKLNFHTLKTSLEYAYMDLFKDIAKWLFIGTLLGASLEFIIPENWSLVENIWLSYGIIVLISLPLYVCATGSIPIALALLAQGFSPGCALLFLSLGPETNSATVSWLWGSFGAKLTSMYLIVLAGLSLGAAIIMDVFFLDLVVAQSMAHHHEESSLGVTIISVLFSLVWGFHLYRLLKSWISKRMGKRQSSGSCCDASDDSTCSSSLAVANPGELHIPIYGITCGSCVQKVQSILDKSGIKSTVNLQPSEVVIIASDLESLKSQDAGLQFEGYKLDLSEFKS